MTLCEIQLTPLCFTTLEFQGSLTHGNSDFLSAQVRDGNAVIFLGAGASRNAQATDGRKCPTTQELTEKLSAQFLGGKYKLLRLIRSSSTRLARVT